MVRGRETVRSETPCVALSKLKLHEQAAWSGPGGGVCLCNNFLDSGLFFYVFYGTSIAPASAVLLHRVRFFSLLPDW